MDLDLLSPYGESCPLYFGMFIMVVFLVDYYYFHYFFNLSFLYYFNSGFSYFFNFMTLNYSINSKVKHSLHFTTAHISLKSNQFRINLFIYHFLCYSALILIFIMVSFNVIFIFFAKLKCYSIVFFTIKNCLLFLPLIYFMVKV